MVVQRIAAITAAIMGSRRQMLRAERGRCTACVTVQGEVVGVLLQDYASGNRSDLDDTSAVLGDVSQCEYWQELDIRVIETLPYSCSRGLDPASAPAYSRFVLKHGGSLR